MEEELVGKDKCWGSDATGFIDMYTFRGWELRCHLGEATRLLTTAFGKAGCVIGTSAHESSISIHLDTTEGEYLKSKSTKSTLLAYSHQLPNLPRSVYHNH